MTIAEPFNGLMPDEAERLALMIEEAGEVIQAATKILRHGYYSFNPHNIYSLSNRGHLEKEIGHLFCALQLMTACGDLTKTRIADACSAKAKSVGEWLHHQAQSEKRPE